MDFDYKKYTSYFSDSKFWIKIKEVAKKVGLKTTAYALILYYILQKKEVPVSDKLLITGCLGYFILPIDLIPDFAPVVGYSDDIAGMIFAVSQKLISWFKVESDYVDKLLKDI